MDFNELLYLSGNDIPFAAARLIIHQPRISEIAYLGEETFYTGCEFLKFNKDILPDEDKIRLENQTNFDILITIMKEQNMTIAKQKTCVLMVLNLLFPEYEIDINDKYISLIKDGEEFKIDNSNFEEFKIIISHMFCLDTNKKDVYNPSGEMAKKIVEKFKHRQQKLQELKGEKGSISILTKYTSILAVGENKDINSLLQYTVFQLFDEFRRYQLKLQWDMTLSAKMAGAKDVKDAEDWMQDLHS